METPRMRITLLLEAEMPFAGDHVVVSAVLQDFRERGNVKVCELLMERGASIAPETTGLSERYGVYRVFLQSGYFNYSDAHYMRSEMLDLLKKVAAKVKLFDEERLHLKTADEQGINPKITAYEPLEACTYSGAD